MKVAHGKILKIGKETDEAQCPICGKVLHWMRDSIKTENKVAICCGRTFRLRPCKFMVLMDKKKGD